jgi:hypothetical protein
MRDDGTFDPFSNRDLARTQMSERTLREELCVTYGFCQDEYDPIRDELERSGRKRILLQPYFLPFFPAFLASSFSVVFSNSSRNAPSACSNTFFSAPPTFAVCGPASVAV